MTTQLEAIEARLGAATPGPWRMATRIEFETNSDWPIGVLVGGSMDGEDYYVVMTDGKTVTGHDLADGKDEATFIAHSPADMAALLAVVQWAVSLGNSQGSCPVCGAQYKKMGWHGLEGENEPHWELCPFGALFEPVESEVEA